MTAAQTFNLTDLDDSERVAWLRAHAVPTGERDGVTTWVMSDGSRVERVATMGAACFGTLPASPALPKPGQLSAGATAATITESEPETVWGTHGRDAQIVKVQGPRVTRYKLRCRASAYSIHGMFMETRVTAWFTSYIRAYDAAEAWSWRGETPQGDAA